MSYTIERGKRVLALKTEDKRFDPCHGELILFVHASACNNVSPRTYDWNAIAHDHASEWGGNVIVPSTIWQCGADADGGSIKPWGKDVSGLAYVKAWKQAVKERRSIDGWMPKASIWVGDNYFANDEADARADDVNAKGAALFGGKYPALYGQPLFEAFKRLFPGTLKPGLETAYVHTREELLDAVYLFIHRKKLPVSFYLGDHEDSAFLKADRSTGVLAS
jgi:hypothetical protein